MKKALILGAGYVGAALAKHWKGKFFVEATTTRKERNLELMAYCDSVRILRGNDTKEIEKAVIDKDIIVVCIAPKHVPDAILDYRTTYLETALTLRKVLGGLKNTPRIVYTSSTGIYNKESTELLHESTQAYSENANQKILKETEDTYLSLMPTIPISIFRLSQIIGPPPRDFVSFVKKLSGMPYPTSGSEYPNVIHVDDIVEAITYAVDKPLTGIYNLSCQLQISRKQIYTQICQTMNLPKVQFGASTAKHSQIITDKILQTGFAFNKSLYNDIVPYGL